MAKRDGGQHEKEAQNWGRGGATRVRQSQPGRDVGGAKHETGRNSCVTKSTEVREFVNEQNFDLFLVQETWLEPGIDPQIANYRLIQRR
ncbi:hypothetical protein TNCV_3214781 [Trichonephila clavipes]|nr:hypothetical protein TNCV_3214781 [Trichonephila clavipes]